MDVSPHFHVIEMESYDAPLQTQMGGAQSPVLHKPLCDARYGDVRSIYLAFVNILQWLMCW